MQNKHHKWRQFEEAREYARSLGLKNYLQWRAWAGSGARPRDIPSNPGAVYIGTGWVSLGDWLGNDRISPKKRSYRPFTEARAVARSLGLKSGYEWKAWAKSPACPKDIPIYPNRFYRDRGWAGLKDWLGYDRIYKKEKAFRPFEEARAYVRTLGLKPYPALPIFCENGEERLSRRREALPRRLGASVWLIEACGRLS
jgi:hypothetical protein